MLAATEDLTSAFTTSAVLGLSNEPVALHTVTDESVWAAQYADWYQVEDVPPFAHFITSLPTALTSAHRPIEV